MRPQRSPKSRRRRLQVDTFGGDAPCNATALESVTFGEQAPGECADASGFSFFLISERPTNDQIGRMCNILACRTTIASLKRVAPTECQLRTTKTDLYLYKDILEPVTTTCGFAMIGSPLDELAKVNGPASMVTSSSDSSDSSDRHMQTTRSSNESSDALGIGPIIALFLGAIVCGLLSAFIAVRVKQQHSDVATKRDDESPELKTNGSAPVADETDDYYSQREYADFNAIAKSSKVSSAPSRASTARSSKPSVGSIGNSSFMIDDVSAPFEDPTLVMLRIPIAKLQIEVLVSQGGYGRVYRGTYDGKLPVVIKKLLPERRQNPQEIAQFLGEAKLMAQLQHERIIRLVGVAWDSVDQHPWVVSEWASGGDLRSLLVTYANERRLVGFSYEKVKIALHVAEALHYMHSLDPLVLHRDLKSRNVLLSAELDARVADFGVCRERSNNTMTAEIGASLWTAPEVMVGEQYDEKADVFSFGVLLCELDTHQLPYADALTQDTDGLQRPLRAILRLVAQGQLSVSFSDRADPDLISLGQQCVSVDARERPTAAELLQRVNQVMSSYVAFV